MIPMNDEAAETRPALPKTPVLLTAATRWEAEPLAKGLGLSASGDGRFEGSVGARRIVLVKTGIGAVKAADVLSRGFVAGDYGVVLSAGLCGAMQQGIATGDLVADPAEVDLDFVVPLRETAKALDLPFHFGKILHTNVVLKPALKRKLGAEYRALACDMETAAVRRWAQAKTPVIGVRAVLDALDDECPPEAPEGEDPASLARFALSHAAGLPALIKTGFRSGRAMRTLSRFLKAYLEAI